MCEASIHRIAAAVNAPKGTFYNYFGSKEELASILVDRQFAAIYQSLSLAPGESAYDQLKHHFQFLAMEPPMIEIAPLQLLAIFAAEAPAIPPGIGQRIAEGIHVWDRQLGDLISLVHIEKGTSVAARLRQTSVTLNHVLVWGDRSQKVGSISKACGRLSSLLAPLRCPLISPCRLSAWLRANGILAFDTFGDSHLEISQTSSLERHSPNSLTDGPFRSIAADSEQFMPRGWFATRGIVGELGRR